MKATALKTVCLPAGQIWVMIARVGRERGQPEPVTAAVRHKAPESVDELWIDM